MEGRSLDSRVRGDDASFEGTRETLALLKLLALGNRDIEAGRSRPARDVVKRLKGKAAGR